MNDEPGHILDQTDDDNDELRAYMARTGRVDKKELAAAKAAIAPVMNQFTESEAVV
jgi:hypothetical protein